MMTAAQLGPAFRAVEHSHKEFKLFAVDRLPRCDLSSTRTICDPLASGTGSQAPQWEIMVSWATAVTR